MITVLHIVSSGASLNSGLCTAQHCGAPLQLDTRRQIPWPWRTHGPTITTVDRWARSLNAGMVRWVSTVWTPNGRVSYKLSRQWLVSKQ